MLKFCRRDGFTLALLLLLRLILLVCLGKQALWEQLACTLLEHFCNCLLVVETLITQFFHNHFNARLNQL